MKLIRAYLKAYWHCLIHFHRLSDWRSMAGDHVVGLWCFDCGKTFYPESENQEAVVNV